MSPHAGCGVERVAERGRADPGGDDFAVKRHFHGRAFEVEAGQRQPLFGQHEERGGAVVGHGVGEGDLPVGNAAVDDLDRGMNRGDGSGDLLGGGIS